MPVQEITSKTAEKILHAAKQLFARQGYHGTSTKELARLAGVAENTIFRHFGRKEDLFWAALRSSLSGLGLHVDPLVQMPESADAEVILRQFFSPLVDAVILRPELLYLIVIAFIELPWNGSAILYEHLSPIISKASDYIIKSIERGKLRKVNSSLLTTAMVSTAIGYATFANLIVGAEIPHSDDREAIRGYSRFWYELLAPVRSAPVRVAAQSADSSQDSSAELRVPRSSGWD